MPDDPRLYHYRATVLTVVDGDTFDATIDVGFRETCIERLRVLGINAPETNRAASRDKGLEAKAFARGLLDGQTVIVRTHKMDNFGRWLSTVWLPDGRDFGRVMLAAGHAVPFVV